MRYFGISLFLCHVAAIWPAPQSYSSGNSVVWIKNDVDVIYNGQNVCWSLEFSSIEMISDAWTSQIKYSTRTQLHFGLDYLSAPTSSSFSSKGVVQYAVKRAMLTIFTEGFVPWKLVPRNQLNAFEPSAHTKKIYIQKLVIAQSGNDSASSFKPLADQVDESYNLTVGADGSASINAISHQGVLRALETFTQLFYTHSKDAGIYSNLAPIKIIDRPVFSHRGLNLDVSRNWYPKADILRTIDAIAWNKFNRLHIHMTDSQSWPLDIPALPELSRNGAYQTGLSYSPQDLQEIQIYAVYRGVEIILEFDMPGHTTAIGLAYPELIAAFDAKPWDMYCAEPPCGSLKLNSTAVYDFLNILFSDIIPRVCLYSAYLHTGGDEVNAQAYLLDDTVGSDLTTVLQPLMQKFVDRNHAQIRKSGLAPMVWEEMLLNWNLTLGDDVVVQTWISEDSLAQVTSRGHKALFGNYNFWYLDCGKGQWLDFSNGASFDMYYPFKDYCNPVKNWRLIYAYDPTAGLSDAQKALVLGGEVHMWSEQTDPVNLDDMVWPRAGAAAEVLWSGRQDANGQNRSQLDASPRLAEMRERMVLRGVKAGPVQMVFCTQHDPSECSL